MISRDWMCENPKCGLGFHSFDQVPVCPECGCVRLRWIPGGGHIGKVAPRADAALRSLAKDYGVTNWNSPSPSRSNRAMEKYEQPPVDPNNFTRRGPFSFEYSDYGATCAPIKTPLDLRGRIAIGPIDQKRGVNLASPRSPSETVPGPKRNASITYMRQR